MSEPVVEPPVVKPAQWNWPQWDWRKIHLRIAALLIARTALQETNFLNATEENWTLAAALIVFALSCNKRGASG